MAIDGCGLVCKYILIIFNIIFAVVGFAFLGLGLWLRFSGSTRGIFEIDQLSSSTFVIGVTVLIVLGSVMLFVVAFGDYGACNEKKCALQVFSVLIFFLAIAEFVVGALAYSNSHEVGRRLGEFYVSLYTIYVNSQDPAIGVTLTFIHNSLHCCGMTGVSLIELVKQTCPKPDGFMEHIVMSNCPLTIVNVFESRAPLVMGIFVGTGALLITALVCAAVLLKQIKKEHQEITAYYSSVY
ncbi:PREDICTED: CD9 antigen-like isoform X2 [Cyprinodon variegatus]|uniref:Tetraspanin n=1 Tax=Cyprinodon variegatus TaxID=28743 RepID=A0A3Q2D5Y7_CYPVA|nr:PREDICTED: CD9 antigen-like isoform X2 [Cyprinodon variegatus]